MLGHIERSPDVGERMERREIEKLAVTEAQQSSRQGVGGLDLNIM